jgi:RES domain-containing protein
MDVFRLARQKYALPLSGKGAAQKGARWNSAGVEIIYTASNRSLAMAEVAVHLTLATLPSDYVMLTISIPDDCIVLKITELQLPEGWNEFPYRQGTQNIGDDFVLENRSLALQIPSVVTKGDYNILINPHHPDFKRVKVVDVAPFPFDRRIFKAN